MGNRNTFSHILKQRVVEALKDQGKTQKEMAEALDITPEHLSRCLKNGKISRTWLIAIAKYLDCSPDWLSSEEQTLNLSSFGYDRKNAIDNQNNILINLFILLGFSEAQFNNLSEIERGNLKTDLALIISYYVLKAKEQGGDE